MLISLACTIVIASIFIMMSFSYTHKRAHKKFAKSKQQAPSLTSFRTLSKALFVSSMLLTLTSYWVSPSWLLQADINPVVQLFGVAMVIIGYFNLQRSFSNLGENYSPLFEAYLPLELVTKGAYSMIRHPIYLYNLFVSFGLAVSSMSALVLINAVIGLLFILRAIHIEERYLANHFSQYSDYTQKTWRMIPYLF